MIGWPREGRLITPPTMFIRVVVIRHHMGETMDWIWIYSIRITLIFIFLPFAVEECFATLCMNKNTTQTLRDVFSGQFEGCGWLRINRKLNRTDRWSPEASQEIHDECGSFFRLCYNGMGEKWIKYFISHYVGFFYLKKNILLLSFLLCDVIVKRNSSGAMVVYDFMYMRCLFLYIPETARCSFLHQYYDLVPVLNLLYTFSHVFLQWEETSSSHCLSLILCF